MPDLGLRGWRTYGNGFVLICSVSHIAGFMCLVRVSGVFLLGQQHYRQEQGRLQVTFAAHTTFRQT